METGWVAKVRVGDDAEVPAAAPTTGPEEIGVVRRIAHEQLAGRGHDLQPHEVVRGRPELTRRVADATAERETGDPDRRARSARDRDAMLRQLVVDAEESRACADRRARARGRHVVEPRDIGDNDAVAARVAGIAVAAGARHDMDPLIPGPAHDPLDIGPRYAVGDGPRFQSVEARVPEQPRARIASGPGDDHVAVEQPREPPHGQVRSRNPRRQSRRRTHDRRTLQELAPVHGGDASAIV